MNDKKYSSRVPHPELAVADLAVLVPVHSPDHRLDLTKPNLQDEDFISFFQVQPSQEGGS